jgi:hypothetical protein
MNHRYFLKVKNCLSPYEVFLDQKELKKTLKKQLEDGPNINNSNIRAALSVYRTQGVGQFSSAVAKTLCDRYCPGNGTVLDPCAGFGARMAGTAASGRVYCGYEPSTETFAALTDLKSWLTAYGNYSIQIFNQCFEDAVVGMKFDMAFTSPPYFDKEKYSDEPTQSFIKYKTYKSWLENFLAPLISKVYSSLVSGSVFILNIDNTDGKNIIDASINEADKAGFLLETVLWSTPRKRPGSRELTSEPFFIYRKS